MEKNNNSNKKIESGIANNRKLEIRQDNKKHLELVDKIRKEAGKK